MDEWGFLEGCRYLIHDRDTKFTIRFAQKTCGAKSET